MDTKVIITSRPEKKTYREGDKFVKLFGESYSKANILNEALNQARVEETDINIPGIRAIEVVDGKWSIVMDYVDGVTIEQLMKDHPEKTEEYIEKFVDLQMFVLSHKVPQLNNLTEKLQARISKSRGELEATTRYELHTRLDTLPRHYCLCHGDFNPSNIILASDGKVYIIDWAHVTQGNASADVANTYLLFYLNGQEKIADKYLELYCKKSDTAKQYVQKWIPIVAAARICVAKPEELPLLKRWADVVDYE